MESSSSTSRFRFRDHLEMENSVQSDTSFDSSSVSSDRDLEPELESMTGKGIKHLCSELIELKEASDEDFHKNIVSSYSAFLSIFEEVEGIENELIQLKHEVSKQQKLVKDLTDGTYLEVLSEQTIDSMFEESERADPSSPSQLQVQINDVSESLDILLSENRVDEVIAVLEMEDEYFQKLQFEEDYTEDGLMLYNAVISEKKDMLTLQLTLLAENPRITAPELQKALGGLCRLGQSHLATQLLLKYYHSRLATGIRDMHSSKSFIHGMYIGQLAKFVFSMISQAARSFVMLYGETSPYALELVQWASEETKVFAGVFKKYVKSILDISGGLSTAVEAMQHAVLFCSLLETQRLDLRPCLIRHIRPCVEEVLQIQIEHFKKVIAIFAAADTWVLGKYLVLGILNVGCSSMVIGQQPEYCLLTNSGRKFVTLLQAITEDVRPLIAQHMESCILEGLMNLYMEYILILEKAITCEANVSKISSPRINFAEALPQQVSVLANLSTLENFFSIITTSILGENNRVNSEAMINQTTDTEQTDLDSCILVIQDATDKLRSQFCQQFIRRIVSSETGFKIVPETCNDSCSDPCKFHIVPSSAFQVLFLELRKLEKLAQNNVFEPDWMTELLRELLEAIFLWISRSKVIWTTTEECFTAQPSSVSDQFVLDMHFLVEITKYGGYFSNNPMVLVSFMKSAFTSAGADPERNFNDDGWAIYATTEAMQRLLEIEKRNVPPSVSEEESRENHYDQASDVSQDGFESSAESSVVSKEDAVDLDASSKVGANTERLIINIEFSPLSSSDLLEEENCFVNRSVKNSTDDSRAEEYAGHESASNAVLSELQPDEKTEMTIVLGTISAVDVIRKATELRVSLEEETGSEPDVGEFVISNPEEDDDDDAEMELRGTEVASMEGSVRLPAQDEKDDQLTCVCSFGKV